jgi:oxygen-independent coproporphyrinogen-3 oxidase
MAKPIRHLYIHIPFCKNICAYCDFVRQVKEDNLSFAYIQRVIKEIDAIPNKLETIYIGGGTPNCLNDEQLTTLLKHACAKLLKTNYEFTVELNPELVNKTQCDILKSHKVNRASIGLQTTNDRLLRKFNRHHCLNDVQ